MVGKCPRPLVRTASKPKLMPKSTSESPPARNEEPTVSPGRVSAAPRLVIGFNPVSQKGDCDESSRYVMEPKASQARSPRSPRSGLESLLSKPRPGDERRHTEVVLGTAPATHAKQGNADEVARMGMATESVALVSELKPIDHCRARSPTPTRPIPIAAAHLQFSSRAESQLGKAVQQGLHKASSQSRGGVRKPSRDVGDDKVVENHVSIFSAASPASGCNESASDSGLIDFLSACFFCQRSLATGNDIFMYRGDRAFCTAECRYNQIVVDERKERCAALTNKPKATGTSESSKYGSKIVAATTAAAA